MVQAVDLGGLLRAGLMETTASNVIDRCCLKFDVILRKIARGCQSNLITLLNESGARVDDRLMTGKEVAAYLKLNERTVLKLVAEGALPGLKVGNQWRFRKAVIDTWLDDQMLGVRPRYVEAPHEQSPRTMLALASCFEARHIIPDLGATTKVTAIAELAEFAHALGLVRDDAWFIGALIQRENVMPSATGNGLAFLHTLRRSPEQVVRPFMVLGRSRKGVDFDALDGRPVHLFFVLGLKYEELHLPWLARLVQMSARQSAVNALLRAPDADALFTSLLDAERRLGHVIGSAET